MTLNNDKHSFRDWNKAFQIQKKEWGLTNELFLLDQKYVLRRARFNNPFTDYQQEIILLNYLKNQTITPKIYDIWTDQKALYLVSKYVKHFKKATLDQTLLKRIAKLIYQFQNFKIPQIKKFAFQANLEQHLKEAKRSLSGQIKAIYTILQAFLKTWKPEKWVLTHNDLVLENILFAKTRTYLIDFEHASLNTPFYDPACVIAENCLWKKQHLWNFWLKQFNIRKEKNEKKVVFLALYRLFIGYLWARTYWNMTNAQKYFLLLLRKEEEIIEFFRIKVATFCEKR